MIIKLGNIFGIHTITGKQLMAIEIPEVGIFSADRYDDHAFQCIELKRPELVKLMKVIFDELTMEEKESAKTDME
jgi:hypothetical protein